MDVVSNTFRVIIEIAMVTRVTWILALMCSGFHLLVFPFPLLILGSILVLFLFGTTYLAVLSCGLYFPGIVLAHIPHQLSLA